MNRSVRSQTATKETPFTMTFWTGRVLEAVGNANLALVAAALLVACAPERSPSGNVDNWAQLCAKTDCNRFPVGYLADQVGADYFYFPISFSSEKDLANVPELYVERDAQGRPRRAVRLREKNEYLSLGPPCCSEISERLGLSAPAGPGYIAPGKVEFYLVQNVPSPVPERAKYRDRFSAKTPEELRAAGFASFDENFWLAYEGESVDPVDAVAGQEFVLVSKSPLLFGRHVALECARLCTAETLMFSAAPQPGYPSVRITNLSNSMPNDCKPVAADCDRTKPFAVVPETLSWIEQIFEALKKQPQSLER